MHAPGERVLAGKPEVGLGEIGDVLRRVEIVDLEAGECLELGPAARDARVVGGKRSARQPTPPRPARREPRLRAARLRSPSSCRLLEEAPTAPTAVDRPPGRRHARRAMPARGGRRR